MNATEHRLRETHSQGPPGKLLRAVVKTFGATRAVDHVDLDLFPAEVHAIVGENGAGKSTLMRVARHFFPDYGGTISVSGEVVNLTSPAERASGAWYRRECGLPPN